MHNLNPESKMWSVGYHWAGSYFQMRLFHRILSLDVSGLWSYPALVHYNGNICWLHIMLRTERIKDKARLLLFPPACSVITPVQSTIVIKYEDLRYASDLPWGDDGKPIGRYPWRGIGKMTLQEYTAAESALMLLYGHAVDQFKISGKLPEEFVNAYKRISHPAFMKYTQCLVPKFASLLG